MTAKSGTVGRMARPRQNTPAAVWKHLSELTPWEKNPRINERAVVKVMASIKRFGLVAALVAWPSRNGRIVAGHTRMEALRRLLLADPKFVPRHAPGVGFLPVRDVEFTSEAEAAAYALADNRLAEEADWNTDMLADLAREILASGEVELTSAGFDQDEVDAILAQPGLAPDDGDDTNSASPATPQGAHASPQTPEGGEFKSFDTNVADDVKAVTCPHCGHKVPV